MPKARLKYFVHCAGGHQQTLVDPLLLEEAKGAFDASHMALVLPSARLALWKWLTVSWWLSLPITALIAFAISLMLPATLPQGGMLFSCIVAALGLQLALLYAFIHHSFTSHLRERKGNPLIDAALFQGTKGRCNTLILTTASSAPPTSSSRVLGSIVLLTGEDADLFKNPIAFTTPLPPLHGLIRCVGSRPGFHGCGMGRAMLLECLELARSMGLEALVLVTTSGMVRAIAMYEREGFVEVRRIPIAPLIGYYLHVYRATLKRTQPQEQKTAAVRGA